MSINLFRRTVIVAMLLLGLGAFLPGRVAAQESDPQPEHLIVVTKQIEPFVFTDEQVPTGFSIDLWNALALEAGLTTEYLIVETVTEQLDAVADGRADVAVAAITITEQREKTVDFSLPYYRSGLGILTTVDDNPNFLDAFNASITPNLIYLVVGLVILLIFIGHLVWLIERNKNEDFRKGYLKGVGDGIWWASVTVTTVGYGDHIPKSIAGRLLGLFWMFAGLFILANFTAGVTASLTTSQLQASIEGPGDLPGKSVVTVKDSTADLWLTSRSITHVTTVHVDEAYEMLEKGTADAIVYDYPVLQYYALTSGNPDLIMGGEAFDIEWYGIAMAQDSVYREPLNQALLKLIEDGTYASIHDRWFGHDGGGI